MLDHRAADVAGRARPPPPVAAGLPAPLAHTLARRSDRAGVAVLSLTVQALEVLVHLSIAVVVQTVAVDVGLGVHVVAGHSAVLGVSTGQPAPLAPTPLPAASADSRPQPAFRRLQLLVGLAVAIVILTVAGLCAGLDLPHARAPLAILVAGLLTALAPPLPHRTRRSRVALPGRPGRADPTATARPPGHGKEDGHSQPGFPHITKRRSAVHADRTTHGCSSSLFAKALQGPWHDRLL